jgi:hypothetical protein
MTTKKRRKNRLPPFIAVFKSIVATPAWRTMSPIGRLANIELRGHLRNDFSNNGSVHLSCRAGAKAIGINKDTVAHGLAENEHYGFLCKTSEGFLGADGRGIAAKYRFTDVAHGTHPPTRDYEKWDGELFTHAPPRKKHDPTTTSGHCHNSSQQNPVRSHRTPRPVPPDIRKGGRGRFVCPVPPDIETAPRCPVPPDISRRTSPQRSGRVKQGSSTARAPVQAGDAGSSPAPVTKKPWAAPHLIEITDPEELRRIREALLTDGDLTYG